MAARVAFVLTLTVLGVCLLQARGQGGLQVPRNTLDGFAWFIQISDTHLSAFDDLPDRQKLYGDKAGDLELFAKTVLSATAPGALLITGDLTDGKTRLGRGQQLEQEWKVYRNALDILERESGLPESAILDMRGNHDAFNMPQRGGEGDNFPAYAATGRRDGTARIYVWPLSSGPYLDADPPKEKCPVGVLIGIDATPDPGLRGPTNFAGTLHETDILELDSTLTGLREKDCNPVLVVYGHYPLPLIAEPETKPWQGRVARAAPAKIGSLLQVLTHHNVSAYLSGHLHGAFGQRLHRLHKMPSGGHLAELENAAWKDDRRFRLLSIDTGELSFTDYSFHTPSKPLTSAGPPSEHMHIFQGCNISITGVAPEVVVRKHFVHITSPPDARYSPMQSSGLNRKRQLFPEVRALVIPVIPDKTTKFPVLPQVLLTWKCAKSGKEGQTMMAQVQQGQNLWRAPWAQYDDSCDAADDLVYIQVHALERVYGRAPPPHASSERRPAALAKGENGRPWFTTPRKPLPLQQTTLEWLALHIDWQQGAVRLFYGLWAFQLGAMLLLPRLAAELHLGEGIRQRLGNRKPGIVRSAFSIAAFPLLSLIDMASLPAVWLPQVLYSVYLFCGPWLAAEFLSEEPPGLFFMGSVLFRHQGEWQRRGDPDTLRVGLVHYVTCVLPLTLWLAAVVSRWRMGSSSGGKGWLLSPALAVTALPVLSFHLLVVYRVCHVMYGWPALLFSPGLAWCCPLLALLLAVLSSCCDEKEKSSTKDKKC